GWSGTSSACAGRWSRARRSRPIAGGSAPRAATPTPRWKLRPSCRRWRRPSRPPSPAVRRARSAGWPCGWAPAGRGRGPGSTMRWAWWCTANGATRSSRASRWPPSMPGPRSTRYRCWTASSWSGMPELPEVETVRRGLEAVLVGRSFEDADIRDGRLTAPFDPQAIAHELRGSVVQRVSRRGKYLVVELDDGRALVCHLRMTGWFHHVPEPSERPHLRAVFGLDDGTWLLYSDQRRFGTMRLLEPGELEEHWLKRVGPEPLHPGWTARELRASLARRRAPVKALLLDQLVVAGVGNIYADEALWEARIHPLTPGAAIGPARAERLHDAVVAVLERGI